MSRRAILAIILSSLTILLVLSYTTQIESAAKNIDQVHWQGYPLPPCFLDAKQCAGHVLGTDENGRDLWARLLVGGRVSLGTALLAALLELAAGIFFGAFARVDGAFMKLVTMGFLNALSCFPAWLFIAVVTIFALPPHRASLAPTILAAIAGLLFAQPVAREVASTHDLRSAGNAALDIALRDWPRILLLLGTVDFFGFGIQAPTPSWGNMLENIQSNYSNAPWVSVFPAVCLFTAAVVIELARRRLIAEPET